MSIPPCLANLIQSSEDMVIYLDLIQLSYHPLYLIKTTHPLGSKKDEIDKKRKHLHFNHASFT
jgi:hypothetical protein